MAKLSHPLINVSTDQLTEVLASDSDESLVLSLKELNFQRLVEAIENIRNLDEKRALKLFSELEKEHLAAKMLEGKYPTLIRFSTRLAGMNDEHLRATLRSLDTSKLIREEELTNIYQFNSLLYLFFKAGMDEEAKKIISFMEPDMDRYVKTNDLRTLTSFLNLISNYRPVKPLIEKYQKRFYSVLKYYEAKTKREQKYSPIPNFIKMVAESNFQLAHKLLIHVNQLVQKNEVNWKTEQHPKAIIAFCDYQLGMVAANQANPDLKVSNQYLGFAQRIFEQLNYAPGLCLAFFQQSKNSAKLGEKLESKLLAAKALMNASEAGLDERSQEIEAFMKTI